MRQITRDLYTSGRVWLSLSHGFTQNSGDKNSFDLVKVNGDFVTLNAGALFVLSLWDSRKKTPDKFYIPEYKIEELRMILSALKELKEDEKYVRDGELTEAGKPSSLYYRLILNNGKYIDLYFVENNYNDEKSINIAIELTPDDKTTAIYSMYDSNVADLIDIIPKPADIAKYKQSAAELYYLRHFMMDSAQHASPQKETNIKNTTKKTAPRTINKVDRTSISNENISYVVDDPKETEVAEEEADTKTPSTEANNEEKTVESGYDYNSLLEDE
jgi:hypothetical protein